MGPLTDEFGVGLESTGSFSQNPPSHPNGSHVCEVEVDPETGEVTIDRYHVVDDLGRIINPMIVRGQIQGGVVQGIGQAPMEDQVYDRESGQLLTGSPPDRDPSYNVSNPMNSLHKLTFRWGHHRRRSCPPRF
jgi:aerobic carbon-monoxide dehydrogenase large subunit